MNQNLNEKSLLFFVTLWHILGRSCTLYITTSSSGKLIIVLRSEDWDYILGTVRNYFTMTYGEKFVSFAKLAVIRSLSLQRTKESLSKAVQLLYTLSLTGKERVLSLSEFMTKFNLPLSSPYSGTFSDNTLIPTIPFFIGFILADGTLFIRLRLVKNSLYIIPMIFIPQIKTEYNTHFLSQLVLMLNYYNIGTVDKETGSMAGFTVSRMCLRNFFLYF